MEPRPMHSLPLPARLVLLHLIGYARWTQILPMLVVWGSVWAILFAFIFVNFQGETISVVSAVAQFAERIGWQPDFGAAASAVDDGSFGTASSTAGLGTTGADGVWRFDERDVRKIILAYWGLVSLVLYVVALLVDRIRGERPPVTLARRFKVAGAWAVATWLAFVVVYITSDEVFHGTALTWFGVFTALAVLPLLASVYSLTIAHVFDQISGALRAGDHGTDDQRPDGPKL